MPQKILKIKKFPIYSMKDHRVILVVGRRGTGKSTLVKDILYHIRKRVDVGFACSPTYDTQIMFEDCLPRSHIYTEYSVEMVRNLMTCMDSLKQQQKHRSAVLTIDDCMFDKTIMKSKEMRELHMNGRHLHLWFINSVQYLMDLPPDIRGQVDYVFCLKESVVANRQKLHKFFFGVFEKYEEFSMVMDKCTNNHECLVLDNTHPENNLEDCIFHYKANPNIGRFRLGKPIYYKLDHYFQRHTENSNLNKNKNGAQKTKLPDPLISKHKIEGVEMVEPEK